MGEITQPDRFLTRRRPPWCRCCAERETIAYHCCKSLWVKIFASTNGRWCGYSWLGDLTQLGDFTQW